MAGDHHASCLAEDPALMKYARVNSQRFRYFRWTNRTAKITFVYAVVVPFLLGSVAYATEGKYQLRGKRRGDIVSEF